MQLKLPFPFSLFSMDHFGSLEKSSFRSLIAIRKKRGWVPFVPLGK